MLKSYWSVIGMLWLAIGCVDKANTTVEYGGFSATARSNDPNELLSASAGAYSTVVDASNRTVSTDWYNRNCRDAVQLGQGAMLTGPNGETCSTWNANGNLGGNGWTRRGDPSLGETNKYFPGGVPQNGNANSTPSTPAAPAANGDELAKLREEVAAADRRSRQALKVQEAMLKEQLSQEGGK